MVKHRATKASVTKRVEERSNNIAEAWRRYVLQEFIEHEGKEETHRERRRGELESSVIICEVTIVAEEKSEGGDASFESGGSHHFSTIGGLSSSWHRFVGAGWSNGSVHRRFVGDYMRRYDYCSSERRVGRRKVEFQESSSFQEVRNIIGRTTLSIFQFHRSCGVALVVGGDLRLTFNFHGSNLRMQGTLKAWQPIGVSFWLLATAEAGIWFRYNIFTTTTMATTVISSFCGIVLEDLHQFRSRYQKVGCCGVELWKGDKSTLRGKKQLKKKKKKRGKKRLVARKFVRYTYFFVFFFSLIR